MELTHELKQKVSQWIADGAKLSDIQSRLASECNVRLTYMEARLLVDDLKLTPLDPIPEASAPEVPAEELAAQPDGIHAPTEEKVALTVDTIARPGTMVSGSVTFSDKKKAAWYLDATGRMGVVPEEQGYRPPSADVEEFQIQLDRELRKLGY